MGADGVSGCRDRRDLFDLVALCGVLAEEISSGQFDLVCRLFGLLRAGPFAGLYDSVSRVAGLHGWRADSTFFRRHPYVPSTVEASDWDGHVHHHRDVRSRAGAAAWRMADRQLRMALHLLHQYYPRNIVDRRSVVQHGDAAHESWSAEKR